MKNLVIGQSGGPTAVINASLYGAVKAFRESGADGHVLGMINGIEGFLADHVMDLSTDLSDKELELLKLTPAAYLGSCRYKLPADLDSEVYPAIFDNFREMNIGYFLYVGGNDSMDTVDKLSRYAEKIGSDVKFIGIPKTIDNDLVLTDHTPGFGSAAKYVASTVREIVLDASVYQQRSVTIVEIMGRHAGWLTAASRLARKYEGDNPCLIYLPETPFSLEQFYNDLDAAFKKSPNLVVCVSEGIADEGGTFVCEYSDAAKLGVKAVLAGETKKMIAFKRDSDMPYKMHCTPEDVSLICNQEKKFPKEWINAAGNDITDDFSAYALPLIQGEPKRVMENGVPKYLYRK